MNFSERQFKGLLFLIRKRFSLQVYSGLLFCYVYTTLLQVLQWSNCPVSRWLLSLI